MRRSLNRRDFIKSSAVGAAGLSLSSCASIDGIFTGEKILFDQEVVIVGGGLSGLLCAHYLQQKNVPFVIFESSEHLGGRIATVRGIKDSGDLFVSELGPWFLRPSQKNAQELFSSLQIPLSQQSLNVRFKGESIQGGHWVDSWKKLNQKMNQQRGQIFASAPSILNYQNAMEQSELVAFDKTTAQQWIQSLSKKDFSGGFLALLTEIIRSQYHANLENVSALQVLVNLDTAYFQSLAEKKSVLIPKMGFGRSIDILSQKLNGNIGKYRIKTGTRLSQIAERKNWFECQFQSASDSRWVLVKRMILTAPTSALVQIKGIMDLNLSERKKQFLQEIQTVPLKSSSKFASGLKNETVPVLNYLESSLEWNSGLEQRQLAFHNLENAGLPEQWDQTINWSTRPGVLGGRINYRPGEFLHYLGAGSESAYDHNLCFAGDTTHSSQFNDLEGAILSARVATERILSTY